ncbi:hypothetical protein E2C01_026081 [Portunus trituberculatus]|uniref:Uncharacterized protein n=1 Tax=Portunus trituberculatus TaxID=210409 RepID=A0A5B7EJQ6_PORTR|nr:hypothetical protein [Portunus trituberculatus]
MNDFLLGRDGTLTCGLPDLRQEGRGRAGPHLRARGGAGLEGERESTLTCGIQAEGLNPTHLPIPVQRACKRRTRW